MRVAFMNNIDSRLDPLDVEAVKKDLDKYGVKHYSMRPGNECIWVSYSLVNCYYILDKEHNIRDVIFD